MEAGLTSPSSNGAVVSLGIKISLELNQKIQSIANNETNGNKSELLRVLILEALERREQIEKMLDDMASETEN